MSGASPALGYVLTSADSVGNATWSTAGSVSGWTTSGNDVYETLGGNVGIGTIILSNGALMVMNGNVGVGTWKPEELLAVGANAFKVNTAGAITATTGITTSGPYTQSGSGINSFSGNVGINSSAPGHALDVQGTVRVNTTGTAAAPSLLIGAANDTGLWQPATSTLAASTAGSERMRINESGFVGIGSSAPGQRLDVTGTV